LSCKRKRGRLAIAPKKGKVFPSFVPPEKGVLSMINFCIQRSRGILVEERKNVGGNFRWGRVSYKRKERGLFHNFRIGL